MGRRRSWCRRESIGDLVVLELSSISLPGWLRDRGWRSPVGPLVLRCRVRISRAMRSAFAVLVLAAQHRIGIAMAHLAPQLLLEHMGIVGDEHVGALENATGGAVVLLQHHHLERGEVTLSSIRFSVARRASVDRLVVIAHHGELGALLHQHLHQQVLGWCWCPGISSTSM